MPLSPRLMPCLLVLAMLGPATGVYAAVRDEVPGRNTEPVTRNAPVEPARTYAPTLEPRGTAEPASFAPRHGWSGYLGHVEGTVRTAIDRARHEEVALRSPLTHEPAARGTASPEGDAEPAIPGRLWLGAVVPNPTSGTATLRYELPAPAHVRVAVFDVAGRIVHEDQRTMQAGRHAFALDLPGVRKAPGVYFVIMDVDGRRVGTRRLVLRR